MSIRKWLVQVLGGTWPEDPMPVRMWTREAQLAHDFSVGIYAAGLSDRCYVRVNPNELGPYQPRPWAPEVWDRVVVHQISTGRELVWMYVARDVRYEHLVERLVSTAKDVLDERLSRDRRKYGIRWVSDNEAELVVH